MKFIKSIIIYTMISSIMFSQIADTYFQANQHGKIDAQADYGSQGMGTGIACGSIGGFLLGAIGGLIGIGGSFFISKSKTIEAPYFRIQQLENDGKTQEYINIYVDSYKNESKRVISKNSLIGGTGGCVVGVIAAVALITSVQADTGY